MGFRRNHDHRIMVYTNGTTDYVLGEHLENHAMPFCIEEVAEGKISRLRLPVEVVEYVVNHLRERRPLEYRRTDAQCFVEFVPDGVKAQEEYTSPEGVRRHRRATFSIDGFLLACALCKLAQSGTSLVAGGLENGERPLKAEGLVGFVPQGWTMADTQPVLL